MERKAILAAFWRAVAAQEKDLLREFFAVVKDFWLLR